jgi:SAM-dependent methyltransferase
MDDVQQTDVEEINGQIREKVRTDPQGLDRLYAGGPLSEAAVNADLASLRSNYDIYHIHFTSHRKGVGRLVVLAKQVLRKLMTPVLERQLAYNDANIRVLCALTKQQTATRNRLQEAVAEQVEGVYRAVREMVTRQIEGLGQQQAAGFQKLRDVVAEQVGGLGQQQTAALQSLRKVLFGELEKRVNDMRADITSKEQRIIELEKVCLQLKTNLTLQERRFGILLEEARKRLPEPFNQDQLELIAGEERHMLDALYLSFEDQFRGTRDDIKGRLRVYLPILERAGIGTNQMPVLDVGCGRGEWLALLEEQGMRAQGVDVNRVLVESCRGQGLEVVEGDAIAYLRSLPDGSLGAVTGFHLIEHLPFDGFIKLLDEAVRVLKPGGLVIFETPNPENVLVGSYRFYLDPTHRNPLPSAIVKFMAEARGLCRVEIISLHPSEEPRVEEAGLEVAVRFNDYFYGPQDYAVLGWKV